MGDETRELMQYHAIATRHQRWELLKAAAAAETDLAADGREPAGYIVAGSKTLMDDISLAEIAILMDDTVTSATISIWAARTGGPAEKVCQIVAVPGTQQVISDPVSSEAVADKVYADTMTVTGYWYDDVRTADAEGNNGCAKALFDLYGRKNLLAMVTAIGGTGAVNVIYSGV